MASGLGKKRRKLEKLRQLYITTAAGHFLTPQEASSVGIKQMTRTQLAAYIRKLDWEIKRIEPLTKEQHQLLMDRE